MFESINILMTCKPIFESTPQCKGTRTPRQLPKRNLPHQATVRIAFRKTRRDVSSCIYYGTYEVRFHLLFIFQRFILFEILFLSVTEIFIVNK